MAKVKLPRQLFEELFPNIQFDELSDEQISFVCKTAKLIIKSAIEGELMPNVIKEEDDGDFAHHHHITFPADIDKKLKLLSAKYHVTPSRMYLQMLISGMEKGHHIPHIPTHSSALTPYLAALGFSERHFQSLLYSYIDDTFENKKCGLIEGGTGIGKTLAILAGANEKATNSQSRVVIATNSISNIHQYIDNYEKLVANEFPMQPMQIILGQGNFVSVTRLTLIIDEPEYQHCKEAVKEWLACSGLYDNVDQHLPPYQLASLEKVCPNIPSSLVRLKPYDKDDHGMIAYNEQFMLDDYPASIILCTHAMLCVDAKRRVYSQKDEDVTQYMAGINAELTAIKTLRDDEPLIAKKKAYNKQLFELIEKKNETVGEMLKDLNIGFLPHYSFLIVDEAHLLENAMSDSLSTQFSFKSASLFIKEMVNTGKLAKGVLDKVNAALKNIISADGGEAKKHFINNDNSHLKSAIENFCNVIIKSKGIKSCDEHFLNEITYLHKSIGNMAKSNLHVSVNFSPIRSYPQAMIGVINTRPFLTALWHQTEASCCISATLYFKKYLEYSASHFIEILAIPKIKCATYTPITPPWLVAPVTQFYIPPSNASGHTYLPVESKEIKDMGSYNEKLTAWHHVIATALKNIHSTSAGGVLVLMTSFTDVLALSELLKADVKPLVLANGELTLAKQKELFLALTKKGQKPLWLGLGGAWTGLDVNGSHIGLASNEIGQMDNVITDLVIPKIPFGLNMSISHTERKKVSYNSAKVEILDTTIRLKQGLGRLVRLEGQPFNRRIFLLDARIHDQKRKGYFSSINQIINTYPRVTEFEISQLEK
jgi:CRISPR type IV-associated DEAD/DEAH-box helicase Csf4